MAHFKPIDDSSILRLFKAVGGITPYPLPLSEAQESRRQHEAIISEIQTFKETEQVKYLARAVGLPFDDRQAPTDSQLLRLYAAVR